MKRCLDRRKALTRSGAAYTTLPTCKYFNLMKFLHEKTENKATDSNIVHPDVIDNSLSTHTNHQSFISSSPNLINAVAPSPPSACSSDTSSEPSEARKCSKRKSSDASTYGNSEVVFLKQMKLLDDRIIESLDGKSAESSEICEDTSFCQSLIPVLKGLPLKKKRLAKVKINSLLYDIEFSNEYDNI